MHALIDEATTDRIPQTTRRAERRHWTAEEEAALRDRFAADGVAALAEELRRSRKAVEDKARLLGLSRTQAQRRADEARGRADFHWTDERRALVTEYRLLAMRYAHRHFAQSHGRVPLEELESAAQHALCHAALRHDPAKSKAQSFIPFAHRVINRWLHRVRKVWHRRCRIWGAQLSTLRVTSDAKKPEAIFADPKAENPVEAADTRTTVAEILRVMPARLRRIVDLKLEGLNDREVGERLGYGRSYVHELFHHAVATARLHFAKVEPELVNA